jgi:hypothetical protein
VPDWLRRILPAWGQHAIERFFHSPLLMILGAVSVALLVGSLVALPWMVARIPVDYFESGADERRRAELRSHPVRTVLRNLFGAVLVITGLAMLVLPGQGLLTILAGIFFLDFPGKRRVERWIVASGPVLRALNGIRRRAGRPPLRVDPRHGRTLP